jgi:hypothetical protein
LSTNFSKKDMDPSDAMRSRSLSPHSLPIEARPVTRFTSPLVMTSREIARIGPLPNNRIVGDASVSILLEMREVGKEFGVTRALDAGEVRADRRERGGHDHLPRADRLSRKSSTSEAIWLRFNGSRRSIMIG